MSVEQENGVRSEVAQRLARIMSSVNSMGI